MKPEKIVTVVSKTERYFAKKCQHNKFVVDTQLGYVKCGLCGEHLNPMWVIEQYANAEHRLFKQFEYLTGLNQELKDKTKCKCQHCGKMTSIASRREINKVR